MSTEERELMIEFMFTAYHELLWGLYTPNHKRPRCVIIFKSQIMLKGQYYTRFYVIICYILKFCCFDFFVIGQRPPSFGVQPPLDEQRTFIFLSKKKKYVHKNIVFLTVFEFLNHLLFCVYKIIGRSWRRFHGRNYPSQQVTEPVPNL